MVGGISLNCDRNAFSMRVEFLCWELVTQGCSFLVLCKILLNCMDVVSLGNEAVL